MDIKHFLFLNIFYKIRLHLISEVLSMFYLLLLNCITYQIPFKSMGLVRFLMLSLMLVKAAFIWSKYSKNSNIVNLFVKNVIYSCDGKAEFFSRHYFSVTWSFRNIFAAQVTFLLIISVENSCIYYLLNIFVITEDTFFRILW